MALGAMLINALHAALEDRKIAFEGVGVAIAANILTLAMIDRVVLFELPANGLVDIGFVGHQNRFPSQVFVE